MTVTPRPRRLRAAGRGGPGLRVGYADTSAAEPTSRLGATELRSDIGTTSFLSTHGTGPWDAGTVAARGGEVKARAPAAHDSSAARIRASSKPTTRVPSITVTGTPL